MSDIIDRKIVEMQFKNEQFEKGIKTSLNSVENLKKGLNVQGVGKGLLSMTSALGQTTLRPVISGVEQLTRRFTTLGVMGMAAINRITNSLITMGKNILDTVTGIKGARLGLQEYETQINAIQTILANTSSKGTTLEQVNNALDELNRYADLTIYNFTEMTKNIGTFTAAGVDLNTSVSAIKGIANLAAVSGSTPQQAATAMYQLSQAISAGTVRLMDWNSVVNAGMGGEVLKNALMETARVHDIAIDKIIEKEGSFRESLSTGWLSKDIMLETLAKFTGDLTADQLLAIGYTQDQITEVMKLGDMANAAATKVKTFTQLKDTLMETAQSGWTTSWRLVLGDFEQARELFTGMSYALGDLVEGSSEGRNKILQVWNDLGGRETIITSVSIAFKRLGQILVPVRDAFVSVFPPMTGERLFKITQAIQHFMERLYTTRTTLKKVERVFKGVFSVFDILGQALGALGKVFLNLLGSAEPLAGKFLDLAANAGDWLTKLAAHIRETDFFGEALERVGGFLISTKEKLVDFAGVVKTAYLNVKEFISEFKTQLSGLWELVKKEFSPVVDIFKNAFSRFKDADTSGLDTFFEKIKERFGNFNLFETVKKIFSGIITGLGELLPKLLPGFLNVASRIATGLANIADAIFEAIQNLEFNNIVDLINSGLLAAIILGIKDFLEEGRGVLENLQGIFDGVGSALETWQTNLKADTLLKIAGAVGILVISLIALSLIDSEKLMYALGAISLLFAELMASMSLFTKMAGAAGMKSLLQVVAAITILSVALLILSAAVSVLAKLSWEELVRGLVGIGALILAVTLSLQGMTANSKGTIKAAAALLIFGLALQLFVLAVKQLGGMDPAQMQQGLAGVGLIFVGIAAFLKLIGDPKKIIATALGITILAVAVNLMALAVKQLGAMEPDELQKGLLAMAGIMAGLAIFVNSIGDAKRVISVAIGVTILAGALNLIALALTTLSTLTWEQLAIGLAGIAASLGFLFLAMTAMPKDMIIKSAALLVAAVALMALGEALTTMGSMSWEEIARGLAVLGGALLILTIGMYAMQGAIAGAAAMMVTAIAIAVLAPALKQLGKLKLEELGIALLAIAGVLAVMGLAALALTPVIPSIMALSVSMALFGVGAMAAGIGLSLFAAGLLALSAGGSGLVAFLVLLISSVVGLIPMIVEQVGLALVVLINALIEAIPLLLEAVTLILLGVIECLVTVIPVLLEGLALIISELLLFLIEITPELVQAGYDLLIALLNGIRDNADDVITTITEIITVLLDSLEENLPILQQEGFDTLVALIDAMADAAEENIPTLIEAIANLGTAIIDGLISGLGSDALERLKDKIVSLANDAISWLAEALGIKSPSREAHYLGEQTTLGFANGVRAYSAVAEIAAEKVGEDTLDAMSNAIGNIANALNEDMNLTPTIRPVINLDEIKRGSARMNAILAETRGLDLSSAALRASAAINVPQNGSNSTNEEGSGGPVINYVQNNYSPTALSRLEIYRQTRNQLQAMKGLVTP